MSDMKSKWFLEINPWGQIPTLQDCDYSLGESSAIVSYILQKKKHDTSFYPSDIKKRHRIQQVISAEMCSLRMACQKPYSTELVYPWFFKKPSASAADLQKMKEEFNKEMNGLKIYLEAYKGPYLTGKDYTLAD